MKVCLKCNSKEISKTGISGNWYKCSGCGYIGEYHPKKKAKVNIKEVRENTAADDYLDYLHDQW